MMPYNEKEETHKALSGVLLGQKSGSALQEEEDCKYNTICHKQKKISSIAQRCWHSWLMIAPA